MIMTKESHYNEWQNVFGGFLFKQNPTVEEKQMQRK